MLYTAINYLKKHSFESDDFRKNPNGEYDQAYYWTNRSIPTIQSNIKYLKKDFEIPKSKKLKYDFNVNNQSADYDQLREGTLSEILREINKLPKNQGLAGTLLGEQLTPSKNHQRSLDWGRASDNKEKELGYHPYKQETIQTPISAIGGSVVGGLMGGMYSKSKTKGALLGALIGGSLLGGLGLGSHAIAKHRNNKAKEKYLDWEKHNPKPADFEEYEKW